MRKVVRNMLAIGATATCAVGVAVAAQASSGDKVMLCHGTASERNPYVLISVDESALAGHFDGTAPGHGPKNNPDILLSVGATACPGVGPE